MKNIRIYLAAADDLKMESLEIADLVTHLNKLFHPRKINLDLIPHGKDMGELHECELCFTLYHTKFGDYSKEDFKKAYTALQESGVNPHKIYVFFKDTQEIEQDLLTFKQSFSTDYGHFFGKFENVDTMRLQFLLQLEAYNNRYSHDKVIKVENQKIMLGEFEAVDFDKVSFVDANNSYTSLRDDIEELNEEIEDLRLELNDKPDNAKKQEKLQKKLNSRNRKQEEFVQLQTAIFDTALRIAEFSGRRISERIERAIAAFEEGDLSKANTILEEAERDAEIAGREFDAAVELTEQKRQNVIFSIEELLLKTDVALGDTKYTIEERIKQVANAYAKARELALKIEYDKEKLYGLLFNYAWFLFAYAKYELALQIYEEALPLCKALHGDDDDEVASIYNNIGLIYESQSNYVKAMEYLFMALEIREKVLGNEHPDTGASYNNIGNVYRDKGEYDKALEEYNKALVILQKELGDEHPDTASIYTNIGNAYHNKGEYDKALEKHEKALVVRQKVLGDEHLDTAVSYNNIGCMYSAKGEYETALKEYNKALKMLQKILGEEHPDTAASYTNIGNAYRNKGEFDKALEANEKALVIRQKVLGDEHPNIAESYSNIGNLHSYKGEFDKALEKHEKALEIQLKTLGEAHPFTAISYKNIVGIYNRKGIHFLKNDEYTLAEEFLLKELEIRKKRHDKNDEDFAFVCFALGLVYSRLDSFLQATPYLEKATSILEKLWGSEYSETIAVYDKITTAYNKLALEYLQNKDYDKAEEYFLKELEIRSKNPASKEGENVEIHSLLQSVRKERQTAKKK